MAEVPHDGDAERQVLGSMLVSSDALDSVLELLVPSDFYLPAHEALFRAIEKQRDAGEKVNAASVRADRWTQEELFRLSVDASPSAVVQTCQIVRDRSVRRQIIGAAEVVKATAYAESSETALEALESAAETVGGHRDRKTLSDGSQALLELLASTDSEPRLPTGFTDLDRVLVGFKPSTLTILGARPSVGKSALALHFAVTASKRETVLFFSLEMSVVEVGQRLAGMLTSVSTDRLRRRELTLDDASAIESVAPKLSNLLVDDDPVLRIADIRSRARRIQRRLGLGLVVVDYLQLMSGRRQENRQVEVADLSRSLKLLAKELSVPVIALSQLSRQLESENRRPRLSDLRESGALEQDADVVMLLDRTRDKKTGHLSSEANLSVAKHRNGPVGNVTLAFEFARSRFVSPVIDSAGQVF